MDYLSFAFVLILAGVVLLAAEVLIPTGGLLIVAALLFFAAGVGTIVVYGDSMEAALAVGGMAVGLPVIGFAMVAAWRRLAIGQALDPGAAAGRATEAPPVAGLEALRGRHGRTVSPMRPSGTVAFDGRRVDALTEGMMLDAGVWVRCVDVKGGRVVVRQLDGAADVSDVRPDEPPVRVEPPPATPAVSPAEGPTRAAEQDDFDIGLDLPPK